MKTSTVVSLVTGGTKGVGYCISKELISKLRRSMTFMTSRENTDGYSPLLAMELGFAATLRSKFLTMDIRDKETVKFHRDDMMSTWGGLDILVNNAGIYFAPDEANFAKQAHSIIGTNYYGTQNVIKTFYNDFNPDARIVNITSNLAHVKTNCGLKKTELKKIARERFSKVENYEQLDDLVHQFLKAVDTGLWEDEGWPTCAYSVSKMAINAYTKILQANFDQDPRKIVVNAVYPASHHKMIDQGDQKIISDEDAARFVFQIATIQPDSRGYLPKGHVIWDEKSFEKDEEGKVSYNAMHE